MLEEFAMMPGPAISQSRSHEVSNRNMAPLLAESTPLNASSSQIMRGPMPDWSYMACNAAMKGLHQRDDLRSLGQQAMIAPVQRAPALRRSVARTRRAVLQPQLEPESVVKYLREPGPPVRIAGGPCPLLRIADSPGQEAAQLILDGFRQQAEVTFQRGKYVVGRALLRHGHPDQPE